MFESCFWSALMGLSVGAGLDFIVTLIGYMVRTVINLLGRG